MAIVKTDHGLVRIKSLTANAPGAKVLLHDLAGAVDALVVISMDKLNLPQSVASALAGQYLAYLIDTRYPKATLSDNFQAWLRANGVELP